MGFNVHKRLVLSTLLGQELESNLSSRASMSTIHSERPFIIGFDNHLNCVKGTVLQTQAIWQIVFAL